MTEILSLIPVALLLLCVLCLICALVSLARAAIDAAEVFSWVALGGFVILVLYILGLIALSVVVATRTLSP